MSELSRRRLRITGRVQGVGFRYFALTKARNLGLCGWVRNQPDGSVLCEVQGEEPALGQFLRGLRDGPRFSRVDDIAMEPLAPSDDVSGGFEIR